MKKTLIEAFIRILGKTRLDHIYRVFQYFLCVNIVTQIYSHKECMTKNILPNQRQNEKRYIMLGAPVYGNLGDQAIAYAQVSFLVNECGVSNLLELDEKSTLKYLLYLKRNLNKNDIIILYGGGNMGRNYFFQEKLRQIVIKSFPDNRIIIFPQTIDYGNSPKDKKSLRKSIKIYSTHKKLTLFAREKTSYEKMQRVYKKNQVYLVPDIVLSIQMKESIKREDKILFCLRDDIEKNVSDSDLYFYLSTLQQLNMSIVSTDTVVDYDIDPENRVEELNKKWDEFRKSKFVVTDRLHGMIFSVITGTPCIALNNSNNKVKLCYKWLENIEGIYFAESQEEFVTVLSMLIEQDIDEVTYDPLTENFHSLIDVIKG